MNEIEFNVTNQKLKPLSRQHLVDKSSNYIKLTFHYLTEDWQGIPKYIIFHKGSKHYLYELGTGCECSINVPATVLVSNQLKFSMYGELDDYRITTQVTGLQLRCSGYVSHTDTMDEEPDKDMYIVLSERVEDLETAILTKTDIGHTHTMEDITDLEINADSVTGFDSKVSIEIKKGYATLENYIRSYYGA